MAQVKEDFSKFCINCIEHKPFTNEEIIAKRKSIEQEVEAMVKRPINVDNFDTVLTDKVLKKIGNQKVIELAGIVKKVIGEDVQLDIEPSEDNRSYHISSNKIKNILKFSTQKTIEDAVKDLKAAFDKKLLDNTLTNKKYFNIKMMNSTNLK